MYGKIKENDNIYITGRIIGDGEIIVEKMISEIYVNCR